MRQNELSSFIWLHFLNQNQKLEEYVEKFAWLLVTDEAYPKCESLSKISSLTISSTIIVKYKNLREIQFIHLSSRNTKTLKAFLLSFSITIYLTSYRKYDSFQLVSEQSWFDKDHITYYAST